MTDIKRVKTTKIVNFKRLPYHVIIDLLKFFEYSIKEDSGELELYGYFKLDRMRKLFQTFNSIQIVKLKFKFYCDLSRIVSLQAGVVNSSGEERKCGFISGNLVFRSLVRLNIDHIRCPLFFNPKEERNSITREVFPVLRFLCIRRISISRESLGIDLQFYPESFSWHPKIYSKSMNEILGDHAKFKSVRNLSIGRGEIFIEPAIVSKYFDGWSDMNSLKCLYLYKVNVDEDLFRKKEFQSLERLEFIRCRINFDGVHWIGCKKVKYFIYHRRTNGSRFPISRIRNLFDGLTFLKFIDNTLIIQEEHGDLFHESLTLILQIREITMEGLKSLRNVERIVLRNVKIPFDGSMWPATFPNLNSLTINRPFRDSNCEMGIFDLDGRFPKLQTVCICGRSMLDCAIWKFSSPTLENLKNMKLRHVSISPIFLMKYKFSNLKNLYLVVPAVTVGNWGQFPNLERLEITNRIVNKNINQLGVFGSIFETYNFPKLKLLKVYGFRMGGCEGVLEKNFANLEDLRVGRDTQASNISQWFTQISFPKVRVMKIGCRGFVKTLKDDFSRWTIDIHSLEHLRIVVKETLANTSEIEFIKEKFPNVSIKKRK